MFEADDYFSAPEDPNIRIWRYIDFPKFISLLESSRLHFTRLDQMEDEYEAAFSEASFGTVRTVREGVENEQLEEMLTEQQSDVMDFVRQINRLGTFVNCWHMNDFESAAMWKIYSGSGIAIQSTYQRLCDSLVDPDEPVYVTSMKYEDFVRFQMRFGEDAWSEPVTYKRKMFEYERELRALWLFPPFTDGKIDLSKPDQPTGFQARVDLRTLVDKVYMSPGRKGWLQRVVRSVLEKYGYPDIEVVPSALDDVPHARSTKGT